jgi:hypothetical protein
MQAGPRSDCTSHVCVRVATTAEARLIRPRKRRREEAPPRSGRIVPIPDKGPGTTASDGFLRVARVPAGAGNSTERLYVQVTGRKRRPKRPLAQPEIMVLHVFSMGGDESDWAKTV